jgi:hypothetical protein
MGEDIMNEDGVWLRLSLNETLSVLRADAA